MYTSCNNNIQAEKYFIFPIVDENIYNSYLNECFTACQNYNGFSYENNNLNFNKSIYLNEWNSNKI